MDMPKCYDSKEQWDAWAAAHSYVRGTGDDRVTLMSRAHTRARNDLDAAIMRASEAGVSVNDAELERLQAIVHALAEQEHKERARAGAVIAQQRDVCEDCTNAYQRQMIREGRCVCPTRVLVGNEAHSWRADEMLPAGLLGVAA